MRTWMIPTKNDPLGTVRRILHIYWEKSNLESILLPLNGNADTTGPTIINAPEQIQMFNPFTPVMPINAAEIVPELVSSGKRVAAVLRPCEIRTLKGMIERKRLTTKNLLTISVDCLGTLPIDEFEWRAKRKGSPKGLAQEALQFARQGGIVPYRYRAACQICESPGAMYADMNIGVLGLPVRKYLMIEIRNKELETLFVDEEFLEEPTLISQRQCVISRLAERGKETRQRIFNGLVGVLPADIDSLVEPLQGCDGCRICLDNCPICTRDYPHQDAIGEYKREEVIEWLVSCSECGICEQSCPKHLPLTIIFAHIRDQLAEM